MTEFYVQVDEAGGTRPVAVDRALSFDGVRETVAAIGHQLAEAWHEAKPTEATVEFGLAMTARSGRLTGLLVDVGGTASLKVTLTWKEASSSE